MVRSYSRKFSQAQLLDILADFQSGSGYQDLAKSYDCSISHIKKQISLLLHSEEEIFCRECKIVKDKESYLHNKKYFNICNSCRDNISLQKKLLRNKKRVKDRLSNPLEKINHNISSSLRNHLKSSGVPKKSKTLEILGYSKAGLVVHLESLFEPWMNWDNYGKYDPKSWNDNDLSTWKWQIDHIIPASIFSYSSTDDEQFKQCWSLSNLRPLSAKQNYLDGVRRVRHK